MKESGFATQDRAIARLTEVYNAKKGVCVANGGTQSDLFSGVRR
ncbi:hypothetical protein SMA5143A_7559 [Streptomyces sp. MA5143a]|nr:hypothetical protein SMA5143A_7559 [Streptomyces sp. MA5143a]